MEMPESLPGRCRDVTVGPVVPRCRGCRDAARLSAGAELGPSITLKVLSALGQEMTTVKAVRGHLTVGQSVPRHDNGAQSTHVPLNAKGTAIEPPGN